MLVRRWDIPMAQPLSPREVFHQLVHGVCDQRWDDLPGLYALETDVIHPLDPFRAPSLRTREQLREHFNAGATVLAEAGLRFEPANITIHDTADPEVIVAEFEYQGTVPGTGEPFALPGIFVIRVRDGQIVSSRDYADHLGFARAIGRLDELVTAVKDLPPPAATAVDVPMRGL
jgi:ketosteroid isomerase-like protein